NGRVYTVSFTASDGHPDGTCDGTVEVCVPHDQDTGTCVDDGPNYSSLGPCKGGTGRLPAGTPPVSLDLRVIGAAGGQATLEYSLPVGSDVLLGVYDLAGRKVATVANSFQAAGLHQVTWNTGALANGMYFYRLRAGTRVISRSVLNLK